MPPSKQERFVPQNRAQRRKMIKAFKGFKPVGRDAAHTMNKHMKINAERLKAQAAADAAILNAAKQGVDNDDSDRHK